MADEFPQETIQLIQSFMGSEEAARTALLSKSWHAAWSTRPDIFFKQCLFLRADDFFFRFTNKTMQRYEDLKLRIQSLRLSMSELEHASLAIELISRALKSSMSELDHASLATDLMSRALKLGALDLDFTHWDRLYSFPNEVLRSETLTTLTLVGFFKIDLKTLDCSKIKSLTLSMNAKFDPFKDLLPKFPLLETLKFDGRRLMNRYEAEIGKLYGQRLMNRSEAEIGNLDARRFINNINRCEAVIRSSYLKRIINQYEAKIGNLDRQRLINLYEAEVGNLGFRRISLEFNTHNYEFHKLEYLYLGDLDVRGSLFASTTGTALSQFPCLKELVIWNCKGLKDIRIWSESLERVTICLEEEGRGECVTEFDVPNIRKFMFEGCGWAHLNFKTTSTQWESDMHITYDHLRTEWFNRLDELLEKLKASKVSLSITNVIEETGNWSGTVTWGPHVVEKLTLDEIDASVVISPAFLDSLFSICRPKLVIRGYDYPSCDPVQEYLFELACKKIVDKVNVELHPRKKASEGWKLVVFRLRWGQALSPDDE